MLMKINNYTCSRNTPQNQTYPLHSHHNSVNQIINHCKANSNHITSAKKKTKKTNKHQTWGLTPINPWPKPHHLPLTTFDQCATTLSHAIIYYSYTIFKKSSTPSPKASRSFKCTSDPHPALIFKYSFSRLDNQIRAIVHHMLLNICKWYQVDFNEAKYNWLWNLLRWMQTQKLTIYKFVYSHSS